MDVRISANLITLNEQSRLERCLRSLSWADEIVVVDSCSSDATVRIARQFTDHVYEHPFDDYASQRNRALVRSTGDWIFSIDADEWVPAGLASEIRGRLSAARGMCHGFWVPIHSRIFGRRFRHGATRDERKLRLFRRGCGYWRGTVHETVALTGDLEVLRHAIEHESTPDLDSYLRKLQRYSLLESERFIAGGRCGAWWRSWVRPLWTFSRLYFAKLGFLDGPESFRFCMLSALECWIAQQRSVERSRVRVGGSGHPPAVARREEAGTYERTAAVA